MAESERVSFLYVVYTSIMINTTYPAVPAPPDQ
jgi:hypothetical protein